MSLPRLNIYRHDVRSRALITLAGDIDPATAPQVRAVLAECLDDGISTIDIDLTTLGSCDITGLRVFLEAAKRATTTHSSLRLHHPSAQTERLLLRTGSSPLLFAAPRDRVPPPPPHDLRERSRATSPYGL
ncbi:anti-sigma factor antagonist [Streptomyces sp. me109]|uniref:STAS domain-containing protein n=1 Tax=Streptomyces sp. me109 TaxID=1827853 RepID=UPI0011CD5C22|nr:STAS domain-containing protein [Streptomyces sp. me109]TXS69614.1 anti-sigma factor antagonist [Streptomyces sp. me109]